MLRMPTVFFVPAVFFVVGPLANLMIVNPFPLSLEHSFPTAWSGGGSIHNFGVPFLGGLL